MFDGLELIKLLKRCPTATNWNAPHSIIFMSGVDEGCRDTTVSAP